MIFLIALLLCTASIFTQSSENPAQWLNDCINWTTKTEADVTALNVEKISEVDLRQYGMRLLRQYLLRKTELINIIYSSWDGKIEAVQYKVDYVDKAKFESDAELARQMIYAYNGRVKSTHESRFSEGKNKPDARGITYEANIEGIFEIGVNVNSDYPNGKWSGYIWVDVTRKK
jgi:hypothetical protein